MTHFKDLLTEVKMSKKRFKSSLVSDTRTGETPQIVGKDIMAMFKTDEFLDFMWDDFQSKSKTSSLNDYEIYADSFVDMVRKYKGDLSGMDNIKKLIGEATINEVKNFSEDSLAHEYAKKFKKSLKKSVKVDYNENGSVSVAFIGGTDTTAVNLIDGMLKNYTKFDHGYSEKELEGKVIEDDKVKLTISKVSEYKWVMDITNK